MVVGNGAWVEAGPAGCVLFCFLFCATAETTSGAGRRWIIMATGNSTPDTIPVHPASNLPLGPRGISGRCSDASAFGLQQLPLMSGLWTLPHFQAKPSSILNRGTQERESPLQDVSLFSFFTFPGAWMWFIAAGALTFGRYLQQ